MSTCEKIKELYESQQKKNIKRALFLTKLSTYASMYNDELLLIYIVTFIVEKHLSIEDTVQEMKMLLKADAIW